MSTARSIAVGLVVAGAGLILLLLGARPAAADTASDEQRFVAKINELRASKGLNQLGVDANLTAVARSWSAQMAAAGGISHNPNLKDQVTEAWSRLGENVGVGGDVDSLFAAFVASPHHYDNLVDPHWTLVGVGVVMQGGTMYTSHEFMQLKGGAAPPPAPRPAPRPTVTAAPRPTSPPVATTRPPPPAPAPPPPAPVATLTVSERERMSIQMLILFDAPSP